MENMHYYKQLCSTPLEAQKEIKGGHLVGKTDINPMWRIKRLTEVFGPQGIGWRIEVVNVTVVEAAGESMVHCHINFYFKKDDGFWSEPIPGFGGNKLCGTGKGSGINDEAYKMALTDAISVCCKGLGMSADIHFQKDKTKYTMNEGVTAYKPCAPDMYKQFVEAAVKGTMTKSGLTAEQSWVKLTGAGEEELAKFRADVDKFRNGGQLL